MKNKFVLKKDSDNIIVDVENKKEYYNIQQLLNLLNDLHNENNYLHLLSLRVMFDINVPDNFNITQRYELPKGSDNYIFDTKHQYGSYSRMLGLQEICSMLNDYENVLRYRNEEIKDLKIDKLLCNCSKCRGREVSLDEILNTNKDCNFCDIPYIALDIIKDYERIK